jgi:hypothetical protein
MKIEGWVFMLTSFLVPEWGKEVFQAQRRALRCLVEEKLDESLVRLRLRLLVEEKLDESLVR